MFAKVVLGAFLLNVIVAAHAHEHTDQEREQKEMEVTRMEKAVNASQKDIDSALSKMKDYQQSLSKEWNVNTTRDSAQQFVKQARARADADAQTLKGRFLSAHQSAQDEGSKIQEASRQLNSNLTAAQSQALHAAIHSSEKNMNHQIDLMATNVKGVRKLNSQTRHDAKHQLAKLQSGYRSKARQHRNDALAAIKDMKRNYIALERAQRKAHYHEERDHNEHVWEHYQDQVGDLDDQLLDQIAQIGDRIEADMEDELDQDEHAHDAVLKDLEAKRRDVTHMANTARRSVATAKRAERAERAEHLSQKKTGQQQGQGQGKGQDTVLTLAAQAQASQLAAVAMVAAIFGGAAGLLVGRNRLRQRRRAGAMPLLD